MSRQDKATTDRHSKILRELVKQPDNKLCADCKHPRWASWNLGVFLCIRCSGIHRGMGTHISRVKSVDLDVWTPEQMESIQKWGNRRANLYWEAHLKPGHVAPDHKMESYIRSKYESRRWASDGPPPADPSVLDGNTESVPESPMIEPQVPPISQRPTHASVNSLSARRPASPSVRVPITTRQPQPRQLLSAAVVDRNQQIEAPTLASPTVQTEPANPAPSQDDLFSLDFHAPPAPSRPAASQPAKDVKQDILSLFSTPASTAAGQTTSAYGQFSPASDSQSPWNQLNTGTLPQISSVPQPTSMVGSSGSGLWGVSSGWDSTPIPPGPTQGNIWGSAASSTLQPSQIQTQQTNILSTNDIWSSSNSAAGIGGDMFGSASTGSTQKKDDVFGDLWGDFK
ncbi:hypothetical protein SERLA73DRAFT_79407 [Serpula lacrymans var. lacrymans S7.3]|uniref:Arf-GAP domain-containing protein n=1 Tax=Serpula lacrymans var. lacrymans (strain S7.3) TaxID=936435 RepID=F8QGA1_SERL3|nr:hypothetical protein SERLA73DRAFT_79407 [Serpula lacrymans var. lacrymans S7.3]